MLRHIAGIAEIVEDFPTAIAFYRDTLGLEVEVKQEENYALVSIPGVLHFGVWSRAHAALCTLGSREQAEQIPLGFTLEFEVEDIQTAAEHIKSNGSVLAHEPREEPWGQKTFRMMGPSGAVIGFAETPWGRKLSQHLKVAATDE